MTTARRDPYIWTTWLTSLLAGDAQCEYAAWFKAHYQFDKLERGDFDLAKWKVEHAQMVDARRRELVVEGWTVSVEDQNKFTIKGRIATLSGKPDLVAVRGTDALVVDCKGGRRRDSDVQQVLVYLFVLPLYHRQITPNHRVVGEVRYRDGAIEIQPEQITPMLRARIVDAIERAGGGTAPPATPSASECSRCDIGPNDCGFRMDVVESAVSTEAF